MQQERIRTLKDFQFQALLGRGGFGSVFLATESGTGLVVAIKRIGKLECQYFILFDICKFLVC